jgi:hypothetical protein
MTDAPDLGALQQRIAELEAELERLRPIEAAAREALAFFAGRRPGFAPTYPRDVLQNALEPQRAGAPRPKGGRPKAARRRR